MRLGRRRALRLAGLLSGAIALAPRSIARAAVAPVAAAADGDGETAELLLEFIRQRAVQSRDPWVEMHVVLALGSSFERDGKNLLDEVVARTLAVEPVGDRQYPYFPLAIERHPFHFLQIMQATDVPEDHVFSTPAGRYSRRQLVEGATALYQPVDASNERSWAVSVLCDEFPPERGRFTTARGKEVVVESLVLDHLRDAEEAFADVFAVMAGEKLYGKGALHTKACNGTHLLYGLVDALRFGYTADELKAHVERLVEATLFRVRLEPVLIDRSLHGPDPMVRLNADAAKFTFLGHVVETLGLASRYVVLSFGSSAQVLLTVVRAELGRITARIATEYDLAQLEQQVPQAYKHLLGDACHAYRGMGLWA